MQYQRRTRSRRKCTEKNSGLSILQSSSYKTSTFCLLCPTFKTLIAKPLPLSRFLSLLSACPPEQTLFFSLTFSFVNQRKTPLSLSQMAEPLTQNAWKPTPISTTSKLYKKLTIPIRISLPTSSLIFFIISFSLLSISLLSLSSEHPTFWFLLSNSIIFFIAAADSKPFKPDYHNEYLTHSSTPRTTYCALESPDSASSHHSQGSKDHSEEKSEPPLGENEKTSSSLKFRPKTSEGAVGGEKMLLRSTTANGERCRLDAGDLSNMSDEELNRRIEEFIRKFNREILLQEMKESEEKEI